MHEGTPDLNAGSAECEGGRDAACVGNAAGSDHRNRDRIDDLGNQGEGADLGRNIVGEKHSTVPARLIALRDHGVDAVSFQKDRLGRDGGGADQHAASRLDPSHQRGLG
jgi:hypothetical protein